MRFLTVLSFVALGAMCGVVLARDPPSTFGGLYDELDLPNLAFRSLDEEFGNEDRLDDFFGLYSFAATPVRGKPVRAGPSRSWTIETDRGTGLSYVRIVRLPDAAARDFVNR